MQMFKDLSKIIRPRKGTVSLEPRSGNSKAFPDPGASAHGTVIPAQPHLEPVFGTIPVMGHLIPCHGQLLL